MGAVVVYNHKGNLNSSVLSRQKKGKSCRTIEPFGRQAQD